MKKSNKSWPSWAPNGLVTAYEQLSRAPEADWKSPEGLDLRFYHVEMGPDYAGLINGIGSKTATLSIVHRLCMDPRMRTVWERLHRAVDDLPPEPNSVAWTKDFHSLATQVAYRSARVMAHDSKADISRADWVSQHAEIAEHARTLACLLEQSRDLLEGINQFGKHIFADAEWDIVLDELSQETAAWDFPWPLDLPESLEPEVNEEKDKPLDAKFEADVSAWKRRYDLQLDHVLRFATISGVLRKVELVASRAAADPPFRPRTSVGDPRVAKLAGSLFSLFWYTFRQPMDEIVATVAEVVTGEEVSTDSVKMRRSRWRAHLERRTT